MQQVVGAYPSFAAAESAVRGLEPHGVSIQNLVIVNERRRVWRKFHDWRPRHSRDAGPDPSYVVYMNDGADPIERVRSLLRSAGTARHGD